MIERKSDKLVFCCIFMISALLIFLRRPDIVLSPIPWAEDGRIWLAQAHNIGVSSIFMVQDGYMQTISRIAYIIGNAFGLEYAPLVANIIAISLRCSMCAFFMTRRFSYIGIEVRLVLAAYFLLMPNISEGYVNITNAQWYLSLYAIGVLVSDKPTSATWKAHDIFILLVSGLSGPFVLFLLPCLIFKYFIPCIKNRCLEGAINYETYIVILCFAIQILALSSGFNKRSNAPLGASIELLATIFSMRIFTGSIFDVRYMEFVTSHVTINLIIFTIYSLLVVTLIIRGDWRVRSIAFFAILMISSSLIKPMMSLHSEQWPAFLSPGSGERYFSIINFIFICSISLSIKLLVKANDRAISLSLIFIIIPVLYSFNIEKVSNIEWKQEIKKYNYSKPGDAVQFSTAPSGWEMEIIKK